MRRVVLGLLASACALAAPPAAFAQLPVASCGGATAVGVPATSAHFTVTGSPAAGRTQQDYLDALEAAYARQVTQFGWWRPPPADGRYTVVVAASPAPERGGRAHPAGDAQNNPATAWDDLDARSSCLHLTNDFDSGAALEAAAARELARMVLIGIGAHDPAPDAALTESTLALMEQLTFPGNPVALGDLWPEFASALGAYGGPEPRSQWLALRGLTERHGDGAHAVLQSVWEAASRGSNGFLAALDEALAARGTPLGQAFHEYAVAARAMRACDADQTPFCFADAGAYVTAKGGRPGDHAAISAPDGSHAGTVDDDYAIQWIRLPDTAADVFVTNTSTAGRLLATGVCTQAGAPVRAPFPVAAAAGETTSLPAFPPPGCTDAAVVVTTASRTAPDPPAAVGRTYLVATAPHSLPLTIALAGTGTGVVTSEPAGITCGPTCSAPFLRGTTVTLRAVPDRSSFFSGWSDACSGSATTCTVSMTAARTVTARFAGVAPPPSESGRISALAKDRKGPRVRLDRLRLARGGRSLSLRLTCPKAERHRCSGYVALVVRAGGRQLKLGRRAFLRVRGGRSRVLRFPLSPRSRRALRGAAAATAVARSRVRDDAFNYVMSRRTLRLAL